MQTSMISTTQGNKLQQQTIYKQSAQKLWKMCSPKKPGESLARLKVIQGISHPVHNSTTLKVILKRFQLYNSPCNSSTKL